MAHQTTFPCSSLLPSTRSSPPVGLPSPPPYQCVFFGPLCDCFFACHNPVGPSRPLGDTRKLKIIPLMLPSTLQLSARLGSQILFKREDLTPVFSFKLRGAYNLMKQLTEEERWRGVIACSAGE